MKNISKVEEKLHVFQHFVAKTESEKCSWLLDVAFQRQ